ncbi:MAG: cupin domain-containing protein [Acidimicrobiales bacterium]
MLAVTTEYPEPQAAPVPLLFLVADTGGGHRAAAAAVAQALEAARPGAFRPVICDPLGGDGSSRLVRAVTGLYGPAIRLAPWIWGGIYHLTDSGPAMKLVNRVLLSRSGPALTEAITKHRPAVIVSFHGLIGSALIRDAAARTTATAPVAAMPAVTPPGGRTTAATPVPPAVLTVVTDLVSVHAAWHHDEADRVVVASAAAAYQQRRRHRGIEPHVGTDRHLAADRHLGTDRHLATDRDLGTDWCADLGLPVDARFKAAPSLAEPRPALRQRLGVDGSRFLVVVTGGGEGSGGVGRQVRALLRHLPDVSVVAICGRNERLRRRLERRPEAGGRLVVTGFVDNMSDWLAAADVLVTKAGPGTIAEAACCGVPLLLGSHVPGQEAGNTELVVDAGAGWRVRTAAQLVRAVDRLQRHPDVRAQMRRASLRLGRPEAAADIAGLIADLATEPHPASDPTPAEDRWIDNPLSGESIRILDHGADSDGQRLSWELVLAPRGHVPSTHAHPGQTERFCVMEGELHFRLGGRSLVIGPGGSVSVPQGTRHHFSNPSPTPVRVLVDAQPALQLEAFLTTAAALARDQFASRRRLPRLVDLALLLDDFAPEARAPRLARLVGGTCHVVARAARRRGGDARYQRLRAG